MAVYYDDECLYIDSATSLREKIRRIDLVISSLMTTALRSAGKDDTKEYWLNDGQTAIKKVYKGTDEVLKSIKDFEAIREMYKNKINGRVVRMVDSKNFTNRNR